MPIYIDALYHYPVKSCAGESVDHALLEATGFKYDRKWMLINKQGRALTQRQQPLLALIHATYTHSGSLHIQHLRLKETLNLNPSDCVQACDVDIWSDSTQAWRAPEAINQQLSAWLNDDIQLVYFNSKTQRSPGQPERFGATARHFADAAPYLIANTESLSQLNHTLNSTGEAPVDIRHFRPNIVIRGLEAFAEHTIHHLALKGQQQPLLRLVDHCQRCVMITINPDSGERRANNSPFTTLSQLNAMPNNAKAPAFGVNAVIASEQTQIIRVGDELEIID